MTPEEFAGLREGDIVRGKSSDVAFIVTGNYGRCVTAVRSVDITNPDEWDLIVKSSNKPTSLLIRRVDAD